MNTHRDETRRLAGALAVGAALALMAPGALAAQGGCDDDVTVDRGDTLAGIAAECDVSLSAILDANPDIDDPSIIYPGQEIDIPGAPESGDADRDRTRPDRDRSDRDRDRGRGDRSDRGRGDRSDRDGRQGARGRSVHTVTSGETLAGIAGRYGVALQALLSLNPDIENPDVIHVGQRIEIPGERRGAGGGRGADRGTGREGPRPVGDDREERARITPRSGDTGTRVTVRGTGFEPNDRVEIGMGPPQSEYDVLGHARADANGSVRATVEVPSWAENGRDYVFVVSSTSRPEDDAVTARFTVRADAGGDEGDRGELRMVVGRLTDEGVECQALRTDDGKLYTLAGDVDGYRNGDRVQVKGRTAEMSICMQGTTLSVVSVAPARGQRRPDRGGDDSLKKVRRLSGTLASGTECTLLRTDDGTRYALTGDLEGYGPGDEVRVEGTEADMSFCMEGEATLEVRAIEGR